MRKLFTILFLMITLVAQAQRQQISYIEETKNWYYVYDEKGKKVYTFSTSQGEVVAYSESFYIVKNGSWYYTCTAKGKKLHTFSVSNVGEVLSATGNTFTSRKGSWIYTWDKNGTRYSQH